MVNLGVKSFVNYVYKVFPVRFCRLVNTLDLRWYFL